MYCSFKLTFFDSSSFPTCDDKYVTAICLLIVPFVKIFVSFRAHSARQHPFIGVEALFCAGGCGG